MKEYELIPVADGVYRVRCLVPGGEHSLCDLIIGTEKAALIDTGNGYGNLPAFLRSVTDKPLVLFNTHNHIDHIAGNALFSEPFHMGQEDIDHCDYANEPFFRQQMLKGLQQIPEGFDEAEYLARGVGQLVPCEEGEVFDLGGKTLQVLATPGHSCGCRSYYLREEGIVYTGDVLGKCMLVFGYASGGRRAQKDSLRKLMSLPVSRIYASHADEPYTMEDLQLFLKVTEEADYAAGIPFPNPLRDGEDARICCVAGMAPEDEDKPGYAAIVLSSFS